MKLVTTPASIIAQANLLSRTWRAFCATAIGASPEVLPDLVHYWRLKLKGYALETMCAQIEALKPWAAALCRSEAEKKKVEADAKAAAEHRHQTQVRIAAALRRIRAI